ncbi:MAG: hypothetical protein CVT49_05135 [candidate division Zixibacteria bacterium HGW-Zixibacteria-1]|nr:MAG: hypothetical protein CVT49_05135 [candidate division Zixibacteria bacterium HGW-Zixibacteria-1]
MHIKSKYILAIFLIIFAASFWSGCGDDDNDNGLNSNNHPPIINSLTADPDTFLVDHSVTVIVLAEDPDSNDVLSYLWEASESWLAPLGDTNVNFMVRLTNCCPIDAMDSAWVKATVTDNHGAKDVDSIKVWITP